MDRRQRKTREAIFRAFCELLSSKHYHQITVGEIIARADVGRATFYAHFETKDFLLKSLCEELFCHVFDAATEGGTSHRHIFECEAPDSLFLHLIRHLQNNDNNILALLACDNNALFLHYFKTNLKELINKQPRLLNEGARALPKDFWVNHAASSFVEAVRWWVKGGMRESAEALSDYFQIALYGEIR